MSSYPHTLNLWGILSQSKRIINAHSRHFLALSVSFLLPLSFSLIIFPTLQQSTLFHHSHPNLSLSFLSFHPTPPHTHSNLNFHPHPTHLSLSSSYDPTRDLTRPDTESSNHFHPTHLSSSYDPIRNLPRPDTQFLLVLFLYTLFAVVLSILGFSTIAYSTFHGFYGRPVKLISSVKSVLYSFLPLVATLIVSGLIRALIVLLFGSFPAILVHCLEFLGFEVDYDSNWFMGLLVLLGVAVLLVFIWLQVNWSLAYVIVIVESKWGYEPLRRSAYLVNGMRWVALSVVLFFGVLIGLLVGGCSSFLVTVGAASSGLWWASFGLILQMVVSSGFATLLMLQSIASSVVLYMYCKALHGELALEIAEEFAREYVYLPYDNEKVPHVVCVVQG